MYKNSSAAFGLDLIAFYLNPLSINLLLLKTCDANIQLRSLRLLLLAENVETLQICVAANKQTILNVYKVCLR